MIRLPGAVSLDDLSPAWAWGDSTGRGVRVAVIDSGIEVDHPRLGGCVDVDAGVMVSVDESGEAVAVPGASVHASVTRKGFVGSAIWPVRV